MKNFQLNQLTQPSTYANPIPPKGFNKSKAYTLGLCCDLTYQQYAQYPKPLAKTGKLANGVSYKIIGSPFIISEAIGTSSIAGQSGGYRSVPAGFVVQCTSGKSSFNVVAIRGTQTYEEWIKDAEAFPTPCVIGNNGGNGYWYSAIEGYDYAGSVHGGFYNVYSQGKNGAQPVAKKIDDIEPYYAFSRPAGSIAAYVNGALNDSKFNKNLPLYVTGHSLGAALAILCSYDIGINFKGYFKKRNLFMYNLAGPPVAAGISIDGINAGGYGQVKKFISNYKKAAINSFRIVNAADIVPISPPPSITVSSATLTFKHVTPNNVTFCAQTGSIGGNHSCSNTYVAYLKQLANGFSANKVVKKTSKTTIKIKVKPAAKRKVKKNAKSILKSAAKGVRRSVAKKN